MSQHIQLYSQQFPSDFSENRFVFGDPEVVPEVTPETEPKTLLESLKEKIKVGLEKLESLSVESTDEEKEELLKEINENILKLANHISGEEFEDIDEARAHLATVVDIRGRLEEFKTNFPGRAVLQEASEKMEEAYTSVRDSADKMMTDVKESTAGKFFGSVKTGFGGLLSFIGIKLGSQFRWGADKIAGFKNGVFRRASYGWNALLAGLDQEQDNSAIKDLPLIGGVYSAFRGILRGTVRLFSRHAVEEAQNKLATMDMEDAMKDALREHDASTNGLMAFVLSEEMLRGFAFSSLSGVYERYCANTDKGKPKHSSLYSFTKAIVLEYVRDEKNWTKFTSGNEYDGGQVALNPSDVLVYAQHNGSYSQYLKIEEKVEAPKNDDAVLKTAAAPTVTEEVAPKIINLFSGTTYNGVDVRVGNTSIKVDNTVWNVTEKSGDPMEFDSARIYEDESEFVKLTLNFKREDETGVSYTNIDSVFLSKDQWDGLVNSMKQLDNSNNKVVTKIGSYEFTFEK